MRSSEILSGDFIILTKKSFAKMCLLLYEISFIFNYNRTLVSEFPDDTVYGWWIGATDLNRYYFAFSVLTALVVQNQFRINLI